MYAKDEAAYSKSYAQGARVWGWDVRRATLGWRWGMKVVDSGVRQMQLDLGLVELKTSTS